jgi:hypothetical protein
MSNCFGPIDCQTVAIDLDVVSVAVLATVVSLYPVTNYITKGWEWRKEVIEASLTDPAKQTYLKLYHRQNVALADAAATFRQFYRKWYGRTRLVVPAAIVGIITFVYAFLLASAGAEKLWPGGPKTFPMLAQTTALGAIGGAYTMITLDSIVRVIQRDLSPEDLYLQALRLMAALPIGYAFAVLYPPNGPLFAFIAAAFPLQQVQSMLRQQALKQLGQSQPANTTADTLTALSGVDLATTDRLNVIGVNTITQLANADPVQLTMRTNFNFNFVLDLQAQALAWVYLETKLATLRPMGLRSSYELCVLQQQAADPGDTMHANAQAVIAQAAGAISLTNEQFANALYQIAGDDYVLFLVEAYGQPDDTAARPASALTAR